MRILYAEDERDLNDIVTRALKGEGYGVDRCFDGRTAWEYLQAAEYDAVILDILMPGLDGLTVLKKLRADDYLVKPFALEELSARLRVMTRSAAGTKSSVLTAGDLTLDTATRRAARNGREIALSAREYALLEYLMLNQGIVLSREKIENHVWDFDYEGGTNVVDVYIRYLRKKIDEGNEQKLIHTVRGMGYVLREDAE